MNAHATPPTWLDRRNPDWERATLCELPELTPAWPDEKGQRRIDAYLVVLAVLATPLALWQLLERVA